MRWLAFLMFFFCVTVYVLFESKALEFEEKTVESTEMIEKKVSVPVFRSERLAGYFEKLVSKISK